MTDNGTRRHRAAILGFAVTLGVALDKFPRTTMAALLVAWVLAPRVKNTAEND